MDKALIRERFARAVGTYGEQAVVQREVAGQLLSRLMACLPAGTVGNVWEAGCGTGGFTHLFLQHYRPQSLLLNDLCPEVEGALRPLLDERIRFIPGDAERFSPGMPLQLIVSCSALQWLDDPLGFMQRCRHHLVPGGRLAVGLYGERNLEELSFLTGQSLRYFSLKEVCGALEGVGYAVEQADEYRTQLSFASPVDVLKHIRQTGVGGLQRQAWSKGRLAEFSRRYRMHFSQPDGTVRLSYHPQFIIAKYK